MYVIPRISALRRLTKFNRYQSKTILIWRGSTTVTMPEHKAIPSALVGGIVPPRPLTL